MKPAKSHDGRIDWEAAKKRLAEAARSMEQTAVLSPERARAVLEERARRLARGQQAERRPAGSVEMLTFVLGPERYGIEARFVREVVNPLEVTPVPGGPGFLAGVANLRGEVLAVFDLRGLLGLAAPPRSERVRMVVLGLDRDEFGLLVDAAEEIVPLDPGEIEAPSAPDGERGRGFVQGVTADARIILDGAALIKDPRLFVKEAV